MRSSRIQKLSLNSVKENILINSYRNLDSLHNSLKTLEKLNCFNSQTFFNETTKIKSYISVILLDANINT